MPFSFVWFLCHIFRYNTCKCFGLKPGDCVFTFIRHFTASDIFSSLLAKTGSWVVGLLLVPIMERFGRTQRQTFKKTKTSWKIVKVALAIIKKASKGILKHSSYLNCTWVSKLFRHIFVLKGDWVFKFKLGFPLKPLGYHAAKIVTGYKNKCDFCFENCLHAFDYQRFVDAPQDTDELCLTSFSFLDLAQIRLLVLWCFLCTDQRLYPATSNNYYFYHTLFGTTVYYFLKTIKKMISA